MFTNRKERAELLEGLVVSNKDATVPVLPQVPVRPPLPLTPALLAADRRAGNAIVGIGVVPARYREPFRPGWWSMHFGLL